MVSVNTSAARLRSDDLFKNVRATLKPHHRISLELLETAFFGELDDDLAQKLAAMRNVDCDALQGYTLQRTMQASAFAARLSRSVKTRTRIAAISPVWAGVS